VFKYVPSPILMFVAFTAQAQDRSADLFSGQWTNDRHSAVVFEFTVNFKGYGSLTSWTGQLSEDSEGPYIRTLWNLTRDVEDAKEDDDLWQSIISGASDFRPVEKSKVSN